LEYARSLIDMIKVQSKPGDLLSLAMPMSSGKRSLKDRILHISKKPKRVLPITILVLVIVVVGVGCAFTGSKKEVNSKENFTPTVVPTIDKPISTVKPTEETPISTVIPTATMQPISNDNKIETKDDENSVTPKKYTQLKKTYYKITNNKLLISYDGKSYIDTQVEISQEMSTTFTSDNLFISDKITAVVVAKDTTADIYVSNNKWKTWSKVTLYSKEKDPFITVPTYNSSTVSFVNAFIGFSTNLNGWIAFGGEVAMGNENNFVFQTTDGGKTWHEVSNSSNAYARVLTGACYTTSETGFLCFRYDVSTHGPIYSTNDGGKTWKELHIKYPIKYANIELTPVSPRFNGKYGIIPMCNTDYVDYNSIVFYLYTKDGGKTWSYNMPD